MKLRINSSFLGISLVIFLAFILSGCAVTHKINYKLEPKTVPMSKVTHPIKVGVVTFEDVRPEIEQSTEKRKESQPKEYGLYTEDKQFKEQPVVLGISRMLAKHLEYAKVFKETQFIEPMNMEIGMQAIPDELKDKYDAILTGKIKHFYGYHKPNAAARSALAPLMLFGAIGGAVYGGATAAIKEPIEGHTYVIEIMLVDTKTHNTLWQGEVEHYIKESKRGMGSYVVALDSLKEAINKLVLKLSKATF